MPGVASCYVTPRALNMPRLQFYLCNVRFLTISLLFLAK
jgi:hypothetical protein